MMRKPVISLTALVLGAACIASCVEAPRGGGPTTADAAVGLPSRVLDLTDWKLTLPVDENGGSGGEAAEVERLAAYASPEHFFATPEDAVVFTAAVDGATTEGSRYPRSELREMQAGDEASWTLAEGGTMSASLVVDAVPVRNDGSPGRLVIGQIHGEDDELVRLYYEDDSVYFVNDRAGPDDEETDFALQNEAGDEPEIALGERFSYLIDARASTLVVEVHADGDVYRSTTAINDVWQSDTFYFKAGVYLGVDDERGSGVGSASFYALDVSHSPGGGRGGLR